MQVVRRVGTSPVALETTLLVHGVPRAQARGLAAELDAVVRREGGSPVFVGVFAGRPTVGLDGPELGEILDAESVPKANASNLGVFIYRRQHAATTVSATMELSAAAGVRVFATGGLGGLHHDLAERPDISADLGAFTRFPVAVVTSGVKSVLDVEGTRELLETLGVCVVGFGTDRFPAFYRRESGAGVDARFDDVAELARFVRTELPRTGRGIVIANPVPSAFEIDLGDWDRWLAEAQGEAGTGREVTPRVLGKLHEVSGGATLRANVELVKANAALAGKLARAMGE
ncbi:pseudouridylate synthase [Phycisphaerales bacterium]|nr:pseudouridylate synthase [Phycisphaerales bacterium]